jgi:transcription elongation factor Elf1
MRVRKPRGERKSKQETKEAYDRVKPMAKCRDCGHEERVLVSRFRKSASPRCERCGGIFDPVSGL